MSVVVFYDLRLKSDIRRVSVPKTKRNNRHKHNILSETARSEPLHMFHFIEIFCRMCCWPVKLLKSEDGLVLRPNFFKFGQKKEKKS